MKTWGDLGVMATWRTNPVQLFGRNSVSGTYGYFRRQREQPGSASVVQSISSSLNDTFRLSATKPRGMVALARKAAPISSKTPENA